LHPYKSECGQNGVWHLNIRLSLDNLFSFICQGWNTFDYHYYKFVKQSFTSLVPEDRCSLWGLNTTQKVKIKQYEPHKKLGFWLSLVSSLSSVCRHSLLSVDFLPDWTITARRRRGWSSCSESTFGHWCATCTYLQEK
jgi:hypothetical protein